MKTAIIILLAVFVIMAVIEIISARNYRLSCGRKIIIIPVTGKMFDIEGVLRETLAMVNAAGSECRVMICPIGANGEIMEICRRFAEENPIFEIADTDDISDF